MIDSIPASRNLAINYRDFNLLTKLNRSWYECPFKSRSLISRLNISRSKASFRQLFARPDKRFCHISLLKSFPSLYELDFRNTHTHPHSVPKLISSNPQIYWFEFAFSTDPPAKSRRSVVVSRKLWKRASSAPKSSPTRRLSQQASNNKNKKLRENLCLCNRSVWTSFGDTFGHISLSQLLLSLWVSSGLVSSSTRAMSFSLLPPTPPHITGLPLTCQCQRQHILSATWRHPVLTCERL